MNRSLSSFRPALLALAVLCSGCASTAAVVPARTLALVDVRFAEGRFDGSALVSGEDSPSEQLAKALLRELARAGRFEVSDARRPGASADDAAQGETPAAAPRREAPGDATLAVRLLACGAWPSSATEFGRTVHWYAGECTAELTARDATGKALATLQETGRWDSPRQERPGGRREKAEAVTAAIDDLAVRLAAGLKPAPAGR
jgi:hypothetical protein